MKPVIPELRSYEVDHGQLQSYANNRAVRDLIAKVRSSSAGGALAQLKELEGVLVMSCSGDLLNEAKALAEEIEKSQEEAAAKKATTSTKSAAPSPVAVGEFDRAAKKQKIQQDLSTTLAEYEGSTGAVALSRVYTKLESDHKWFTANCLLSEAQEAENARLKSSGTTEGIVTKGSLAHEKLKSFFELVNEDSIATLAASYKLTDDGSDAIDAQVEEMAKAHQAKKEKAGAMSGKGIKSAGAAASKLSERIQNKIDGGSEPPSVGESDAALEIFKFAKEAVSLAKANPYKSAFLLNRVASNFVDQETSSAARLPKFGGLEASSFNIGVLDSQIAEIENDKAKIIEQRGDVVIPNLYVVDIEFPKLISNNADLVRLLESAEGISSLEGSIKDKSALFSKDEEYKAVQQYLGAELTADNFDQFFNILGDKVALKEGAKERLVKSTGSDNPDQRIDEKLVARITTAFGKKDSLSSVVKMGVWNSIEGIKKDDPDFSLRSNLIEVISKYKDEGEENLEAFFRLFAVKKEAGVVTVTANAAEFAKVNVAAVERFVTYVNNTYGANIADGAPSLVGALNKREIQLSEKERECLNKVSGVLGEERLEDVYKIEKESLKLRPNKRLEIAENAPKDVEEDAPTMTVAEIKELFSKLEKYIDRVAKKTPVKSVMTAIQNDRFKWPAEIPESCKETLLTKSKEGQFVKEVKAALKAPAATSTSERDFAIDEETRVAISDFVLGVGGLATPSEVGVDKAKLASEKRWSEEDIGNVKKIISSQKIKDLYQQSIRYMALEADNGYLLLSNPRVTKDDIELCKKFKDAYIGAARCLAAQGEKDFGLDGDLSKKIGDKLTKKIADDKKAIKFEDVDFYRLLNAPFSGDKTYADILIEQCSASSDSQVKNVAVFLADLKVLVSSFESDFRKSPVVPSRNNEIKAFLFKYLGGTEEPKKSSISLVGEDGVKITSSLALNGGVVNYKVLASDVTPFNTNTARSYDAIVDRITKDPKDVVGALESQLKKFTEQYSYPDKLTACLAGRKADAAVSRCADIIEDVVNEQIAVEKKKYEGVLADVVPTVANKKSEIAKAEKEKASLEREVDELEKKSEAFMTEARRVFMTSCDTSIPKSERDKVFESYEQKLKTCSYLGLNDSGELFSDDQRMVKGFAELASSKDADLAVRLLEIGKEREVLERELKVTKISPSDKSEKERQLKECNDKEAELLKSKESSSKLAKAILELDAEKSGLTPSPDSLEGENKVELNTRLSAIKEGRQSLILSELPREMLIKEVLEARQNAGIGGSGQGQGGGGASGDAQEKSAAGKQARDKYLRLRSIVSRKSPVRAKLQATIEEQLQPKVISGSYASGISLAGSKSNQKTVRVGYDERRRKLIPESEGAHFDEKSRLCSFEHVKFDESHVFKNDENSRNTDPKSGIFNNVSLSAVRFNQCEFYHVDFSQVKDLEKAAISNSKFVGVDFSEIKNADLLIRTLKSKGCEFDQCRLEKDQDFNFTEAAKPATRIKLVFVEAVKGGRGSNPGISQ